MEAASEQVVVVQQTRSEGNPFVLFIFFLLTLALHYLLPLLGTLYSQNQPKKWIAYWLILLSLNFLLKPVLAFCFGATAAAFLHLVVGVGLLYVSSTKNADLIVETGDTGINIANQIYEMAKERVTGLLRQNRLIQ